MRTIIGIGLAATLGFVVAGCSSEDGPAAETVDVQASGSPQGGTPASGPSDTPLPVANSEELTINPNAKIEGPGSKL